jgi:four helix bundle protein
MLSEYKQKLEKLMDEYAHFIYKITRDFPKEELYGVVSQIRRAALPIILNYKEGYARRRLPVQLHFFEISYGSLKESKYLLHFSLVEKWITSEIYQKGLNMADEIGKMLWTEISNTEKAISSKTQKQ